MKHIYLLLFMLIPMAGMAQEGISQDTTLYVNGRKILIKENEGKIKVKLYEQSSHGDTIENDQIFEGIYTDGQTTERRTAFTVPFVKRKNHYRFDPHIAGFYMGYTRLSDGINFNTPDGLNINANKSWEIGFNLFQGSLTLSRDRQCYQVYHTLEKEREDLIIAGCWVHARRRFDEALAVVPKESRKESASFLIIKQIQAIYREEVPEGLSLDPLP